MHSKEMRGPARRLAGPRVGAVNGPSGVRRARSGTIHRRDFVCSVADINEAGPLPGEGDIVCASLSL